MLNDITFDLPNGPKNLSPMFPTIDWRLLAEYWLELIDDTNVTVCSTPINKVTNEWSYPAIVRLHFLNYNGRYDSLTFQKFTKSDEVKSESWTKPLPLSPVKTDGGLSRANVRAVETYSAVTWAYSEEAQQWIQELIESPLVFAEWTGTENQADDYVPVIIIDKNHVTKKEDERFVYELTLDFKVSNEKIGLRT